MAKNSDFSHACDLYRIAYDLASRALESAAADVLNACPGLTDYYAAMGSACFYDENGPVSEDYGTATKEELRKIEAFERRYVRPFVDMFGPTFMPVKLTRNGDKLDRETDW